jgi:hypothetical protein
MWGIPGIIISSFFFYYCRPQSSQFQVLVIVVREADVPIISFVPKIRPRSAARGASNYCAGTRVSNGVPWDGGNRFPPRPVGPRKTGWDLDSYLGYTAGPRPVPNRSRLLKSLFYVS